MRLILIPSRVKFTCEVSRPRPDAGHSNSPDNHNLSVCRPRRNSLSIFLFFVPRICVLSTRTFICDCWPSSSLHNNVCSFGPAQREQRNNSSSVFLYWQSVGPALRLISESLFLSPVTFISEFNSRSTLQQLLSSYFVRSHFDTSHQHDCIHI